VELGLLQFAGCNLPSKILTVGSVFQNGATTRVAGRLRKGFTDEVNTCNANLPIVRFMNVPVLSFYIGYWTTLTEFSEKN
jgi:hypothetical protein